MRILGANIPDNKQVLYALRYISGIGLTRSRQILTKTKIDLAKRAKDLTSEEVGAIRDAVEGKYVIEGELRRETLGHIRRLKDIGSWRGMRHSRGLPARGQRTKTNSRTVRGNVRKTVGSGRKPPATAT